MKSFKEISNSVVQKANKKYGIRHVHIDSRCASATDTKTYITSPKIKSKLDLLAYLHELGHCRSEQPDLYMAVHGNLFGKWVTPRILCEYNAWVWAIRYYKRLGYNLAPCHKKMISHYFGGYLKEAENKKIAKEISIKFKNEFGVDCKVEEDVFIPSTFIDFKFTVPIAFVDCSFVVTKPRMHKKLPSTQEKPKHWKPWHDMKDKQIKKTWRNMR